MIPEPTPPLCRKGRGRRCGADLRKLRRRGRRPGRQGGKRMRQKVEGMTSGREGPGRSRKGGEGHWPRDRDKWLTRVHMSEEDH